MLFVYRVAYRYIPGEESFEYSNPSLLVFSLNENKKMINIENG